MPFLSYQGEISDALANAGDLIRAGASMVKLEGGDEQALAVVAKLTASGIPVLAHIGHTPQSELQRASRSRLQGRDPQQARYLRDQAAALEKAGAFGVVLEMVTVEVATEISRSLAVPTIGIGSGAGCDGQILVVDDMLGLSPQKFRFVKRYAELSEVMMGAFQAYVSEVRSGDFPAAEHGFSG
jgi:3-methyl-2-oxobutanoate hydroxymethyltransferase